MGTLENSEDPDEMPHNAFHQGQHCLLRQNQSSEKEIQFFFENCNRSPLNIHIGPTVSNFMEHSTGA